VTQHEKTKATPLYQKLALGVFLLAALLITAVLALSLWSSETYHQEVTQQLNRDIAQYILDHQKEPLMIAGNAEEAASLQPNKTALKGIAMHAMMINPLVEVFLVDKRGVVLGHALEHEVPLEKVSVAPIEAFLAQDKAIVRGDHPRDPSVQQIFSVAPVSVAGNTEAYLYVMLSSHEAAGIAEQLSGSYVMRISAVGLLAISLLALLVAWLLLRQMTRPLRKLSAEVAAFRRDQYPIAADDKLDELQSLRQTFELMRERIQQQLQQINDNDQLRRELISNVSHDLRTPLASIQGYIETLLVREPENEEQRIEYLQIALRQSQRLSHLVNELFELSKLEAGVIEPELEIFSLADLVHDIASEYRLKAEQRAVKVEIEHGDAPCPVYADIALIQRVFQNLLDNALKYTPDGGLVSIALREENGRVLVEIADNGAGIKPMDLPHVFERNYQGQGASSGETKTDSGLGLAIVRCILDLHQSTVQVGSEQNRGAVFTFPLPMPQQALA
jgi:signal transduction histidine kinase